MKRQKLYFPLFIVFLLTVSSCFKDDVVINLEDLSNYDRDKYLEAPIVNLSIEASDLLDNLSDNFNDYLQIEDDGLLCIKYKDSINAVWNDVVNFEEIDYQYTFAPADLLKSTKTAISTEKQIKINASSKQRFDNMVVDESVLSLEMTFPAGLSGIVTVTFPELQLNNETLILTYDASVSPQTQDTNLTGYSITFNHNANKEESYITMQIESNDVTGFGPTSGNVSAHLILSTLKPEVLFGYFGTEDVIHQSNSFNFSFYNDLNVDGMIEFYDFQIDANFNNYFGVPYNGTIDSIWVRNSNSGEPAINVDSITLFVEPATYSSQINPTYNSYKYNRDNSNLINAINLYPDKVDYSMIVEINPDSTEVTNFVTQTNQITGNVSFIIPMWLRTSAYTRTDTVANFKLFNNISSNDSTSYVKSATLSLEMENYFPFELSMQVYYTDQNYTIIDSLFDSESDFLVSGVLDQNDIVNSPGHSTLEIELTKDEIDYYNAQGVSSLLISTKTSTSNNGEDFVKILDSYGLKFNINASVVGDDLDLMNLK